MRRRAGTPAPRFCNTSPQMRRPWLPVGFCVAVAKDRGTMILSSHSMGVIFRNLIAALACVFSWSGSVIPSGAGESRAYINRFWQTAEGLPSNVINDIEVDRDGFVWMGTGAGVARFDGAKFDLFDSESGLPDTQIHSLHLDRKNRPWAGTRRGAA